jgi:hypothetical protein
MARKRKADASTSRTDTRAERLTALAEPTPVAGVPGPGSWLVTQYKPTTLFSLKMSLATSSVGKTLLVPTPYSIKMAFVDAAFRSGLSNEDSADFLRSLVGVDVRVAPPEAAVATHTFVKVRQEARAPNWDKKKQNEEQYWGALVEKLSSLYPGIPVTAWKELNIEELTRKINAAYDSSIAYREVVHHHGVWRWAFDLAAGNDTLAERLVLIAPHVSYIGKRGSFIQFTGFSRQSELSSEFTQSAQTQWVLPPRAHIAPLDDFGPDADLETLSSFTSKKPSRGKHRRFVDTVIPLGLVNTGPGFSEYRQK